MRVAQEEDLRKKASQLAAKYVLCSANSNPRSNKKVPSPPKGFDSVDYERTLQVLELQSLAQYQVEQLQALHKLQRELEKKVLQLKVLLFATNGTYGRRYLTQLHFPSSCTSIMTQSIALKFTTWKSSMPKRVSSNRRCTSFWLRSRTSSTSSFLSNKKNSSRSSKSLRSVQRMYLDLTSRR